MGQFSWYTQDTEEPIYNDWDLYGDQQTVHMVDPRDGHDYVETAYEGYGVFGGMDFYLLLSDLNKDLIRDIYTRKKELKKYEALYEKPLNELTKEESRERRLDGIHIDDNPLTKMYPVLVMDYNNWKNFVGKRPHWHENQGWHANEPEDEE